MTWTKFPDVGRAGARVYATRIHAEMTRSIHGTNQFYFWDLYLRAATDALHAMLVSFTGFCLGLLLGYETNFKGRFFETRSKFSLNSFRDHTDHRKRERRHAPRRVNDIIGQVWPAHCKSGFQVQQEQHIVSCFINSVLIAK